MRLFYAVELPAQVQSSLGRLRGDDGNYRWVDPSLMHVTLAFLGEQRPDKLNQLKEIGHQVASSTQAGRLTIGGAGMFGSPRAPKVLWVGLQGDLTLLRELQQHLSRELRKAGFELEDRTFSPHITLARRRGQAGKGTPDWPPSTPPGPFHAPLDHLTLFESHLSPRGAQYTALAHFPLTAR